MVQWHPHMKTVYIFTFFVLGTTATTPSESLLWLASEEEICWSLDSSCLLLLLLYVSWLLTG